MNSRRALNLRAGKPAVALLALALAMAACSSAPPLAQDSNVLLGDTMHGRMIPGRTHQTFTFEGVESTILDAYLKTDDKDAAPLIVIHDPEGQSLDVAAHTTSEEGSHEVVIRGLVLPKTGKYKVIARPGDPDRQVFYRFTHAIRWAPMPDRKVHLSASKSQPVHIAAPRGGVITFSIKPDRGSDMVPQIQAVKDPWGGPALDRSQVPAGAPLPQVTHSRDGKTVLTFTAPKPGMYTILAAAKPGKEGVGTLHVGLQEPARANRLVYHNDSAARGFGIPGRTIDTGASAAPVHPQMGPGTPPPPPPPSAAILRNTAAPLPPVDPAIAQR